MDSVIQAQALTKKFGKLTAVDHIGFNIRKGQCFGFLGPNGAGKTTTMRMTYLLSEPSDGELLVFGTDVNKTHDPYALKMRMGVVPQEDNLDQELTVHDTLRVFCRFYGLYGEAAEQRTAELLDMVKLSHKAGSKVLQLSGGMRRRLQIARALIGKPELLILDEPTTGLDPQMRNELWNNLKELKQKQVTSVLTTHYMQEAEQLCDDLVIMDLGKIVAQGHPRELIRKHVAPFVVEVIFEGAVAPQTVWLQTLKKQMPDHENLADRLLFYTQDSNELARQIMQYEPSATVYQRHSTLDDVFLKITGKKLEV